MDWAWVIFMVVGVGVWLLVTAFRKAEEERQRNLPRPGGGDGNRGPGRRPVTDLDRFLEEARRRRDGGERPQPYKDPTWAVPVAKPVRPPREVQRTLEARRDFVPSVRRSASEPRPAPAVPAPSQSPSRPAPPPARAPVVLELDPDTEAAPALGLPADMEAPPPPAAPLGGVLARPTRHVSPVVAQLPALLRQPRTVAAAFALREIFGPPLCRKFTLPTDAVTPRS